MEQLSQIGQAGKRAVRADNRASLEIDRADSGIRRAVGDPTRFVVGLEQELGRMRRHDDSSYLLMLTPDSRIEVTSLDRLGARFAANLRSYDSLCRYGANHFLVMLPHVRDRDVGGIVRRLRIQVAGYPLKLAGGNDAFVTATTGGVMLDFGSSLHENIDRAVLACSIAQRDGGNCDQMWRPGMQAA
jgi:hypothetical protein